MQTVDADAMLMPMLMLNADYSHMALLLIQLPHVLYKCLLVRLISQLGFK